MQGESSFNTIVAGAPKYSFIVILWVLHHLLLYFRFCNRIHECGNGRLLLLLLAICLRHDPCCKSWLSFHHPCSQFRKIFCCMQTIMDPYQKMPSCKLHRQRGCVCRCFQHSKISGIRGNS